MRGYTMDEDEELQAARGASPTLRRLSDETGAS